MSCRTTPAGSALTSLARIADGPGSPLSDVSTLSLFHAQRRLYQEELENSRNNSFLAERLRSAHPDDWESRLENVIIARRAGLHSAEDQDIRAIYLGILERAEQQILNDETLTEARKASLLARIEAAKSADTPDRATVFALGTISDEVEDAREAQLSLLSEYSAVMGVSQEDAITRLRELENSIDRARNAATDEYYTHENRESARQNGIVDEAGMVRAYTIMKKEIRDRRISEATERPRLIDTHTDIPNGGSPAPGTPYIVLAWGQDTISGHTEFKVKNTETGEIELKSYRITNSISNGMSGSYTPWGRSNNSPMTPGEYWLSEIANRGWYTYPSEEDALAAGAASRCALCGQFANLSHACPDRFGGARRYVLNARNGEYVRTSGQTIDYEAMNSNGEGIPAELRVDLPMVNDYRSAFRETGMMLIRNVSAGADWRDRTNEYLTGNRRGWIAIRGDVAIIRQEDGTITANTDALTCTCAEYLANNSCRHVVAVGAAAIKRATPPTRSARSMTPEEREELARRKQAEREAALASDWTRNEETLAEARKLFANNAEVSYYENFSSFVSEYNAARSEKENNGKVNISYAKENALGGLATRESGQGFGVEIEYDFPETMTMQERREAEIKIGTALKEANITPSAEKSGYHSAAQKGYKDVHVDESGKGTWSWEHDGSVAGEIVTPTMYDEPETWEKLETVIKILKDNGAVASARTGAHVHVGTGALFGQDPNKYAELARLYTQHEDVIYRLATDPERGTHRGIKTGFNYASPNPSVAPSGFADYAAVRRWQGYRTRAINLNGVVMNEDYKKSHVEFRVFDGTLDAGAIQSQIKLSVAMTNAAARAADEGGTTRKKEPIGVHAERVKSRGRRRPTEEDVKEETSTFRSLLDTLFTRKSDKDQLVKIFAANEWVKLTKAQKNRFNN